MSAPIVVFTYCRYDCTKRLLDSLNSNPEASDTMLYIYSDAARTEKKEAEVAKVRKLLDDFSKQNNFAGTKVMKADRNQGLANSIISGVTDVLKEWDCVIVLEDDLIVSRDYIKYMNCLLDYYKMNNQVGAVTGFSYQLKELKNYQYDTYMVKTGNTWGWGTWKDIWEQCDWNVSDYIAFKSNKKKRKSFDQNQYEISKMLDEQMEGKIDSWAVRWDYHFWKKSLWTIYSSKSRVRHEGFGELATHCNNENEEWYHDNFTMEAIPFTVESISPRADLVRAVSNYKRSNLKKWVLKWIKRFIPGLEILR